MVWLYKTVEFGKRDYQKLYTSFKDIEETAHREAEDDLVIEFPDYREKKNTMKKSDFEAFLQKRILSYKGSIGEGKNQRVFR